LLDWHIDIKSEEEKRREVEAQMAGMVPSAPRTSLEALEGLGEKTREKLVEAGISSVEELAEKTPEQLMEIGGIGEKMVQKIASAVKQHFEPEPAAAAEAGAAETAPASEPAGEPAAESEETDVAAETTPTESGPER
ncbi:MAG: helix-hairpin-helix domain-containing protein, partial [Alphaproteobacteria bacterium]